MDIFQLRKLPLGLPGPLGNVLYVMDGHRTLLSAEYGRLQQERQYLHFHRCVLILRTKFPLNIPVSAPHRCVPLQHHGHSNTRLEARRTRGRIPERQRCPCELRYDLITGLRSTEQLGEREGEVRYSRWQTCKLWRKLYGWGCLFLQNAGA